MATPKHIRETKHDNDKSPHQASGQSDDDSTSPTPLPHPQVDNMIVEPVTSFPVRRLSAPIPGVRAFQSRYEEAVPDLPVDRVRGLVESGAPWSAMVDLMQAAAPHSFFIYFRNDIHPVMVNAGDTNDCVGYLMGNHVIAEMMFRHDPRAMLYAPLRTLIWEEPSGRAWFTVDQPSTLFGSLGIPEVAKVGEDLDRKLVSLLEALDVPVPAPLVAVRDASSGPAT
jgi:hypothetical protein